MILLHRLTTRNFKQLTEVTLQFPDSGTILIEGHNEAGKSSLFEAVYFGLFGDALDAANIGSLKSYGAESMKVELEFSIDQRRFTIERAIKQQQSLRLTCPTPDGGTEVITSARVANQRIKEEMALSKEALFNTCFVEQKKLDQLENQDRNARRATINELLNIKALNDLELEFKIEQ